MTVPLSDTEVTETQTVNLWCELSKPNQTVTWYRDGADIPLTDTHYKISNEEFRYTLAIDNCLLEDGAEYSMACGDVSTSATLTVGGKSQHLQWLVNVNTCSGC